MIGDTPAATGFDIWYAHQFGGSIADDETHFDRGELWDAYNAGRDDGRADEREACARLVESAGPDELRQFGNHAAYYARLVRARTTT